MNVLEQYEFHVQIAEEDVRDGDATPWERVVAAFASTIRELQARVETTTWYNGTLLTELSTLRRRVADLEAEARRDIVTEVGTLALHPIVETRISESEFQDSVCPVCKGHEDDGHESGCVWGDFVRIINREMDDQ